ncbi:MAG: GDP-mannose 4,6-dehydratase, partial [Ilumatobacteraceae bacterium]
MQLSELIELLSVDGNGGWFKSHTLMAAASVDVSSNLTSFQTGSGHAMFASSAATYGEPESGVCLESEQHTPMNPYGWSKRMTEIMLSDYA